MRRRRPPGEPVAGLDQRPVEPLAVVRHEPRVRRDPAGDLGEQRGLVRVVREQQLRLAEDRPVPAGEARRGTRASRRPSRGRSSPCRCRRAVHPAAGARAGRARRSRSTGISIGGTTRRTRQPPSPSVASAAERRGQPRGQGRAAASGERRTRRLLVRPHRRAAGPRQRRAQVREPPLAGDGRGGVHGHATAARFAGRSGRRLRPERREQPQRERLAVHLGLEPRARCRPDSPRRTGRPGSDRRPHPRARRGGRTGARRAPRRRASPRTGRSWAPRGGATGPARRGRGRGGPPSAAPRPRPGSRARRRSARRPARPAASPAAAPSAVSQ